MKVFYSWQSDTPGKVGRTFVREALEAAIAGLDLEDAARPEIDQDTKAVLGAPVIADVIFQKIRTSKAVVAVCMSEPGAVIGEGRVFATTAAYEGEIACL